MNLLLDTHIAVWAAADLPRLPRAARRLIADPNNEVVVSVVSLWEIAIKHALDRRGARRMQLPPREAAEAMDASGFRWLEVTRGHVLGVTELPPLHGDPFDRLLIAQALSEPLRLLTSDEQLAAYSDTVILA